jgi:hypothetical protein
MYRYLSASEEPNVLFEHVVLSGGNMEYIRIFFFAMRNLLEKTHLEEYVSEMMMIILRWMV